MKRYLYGMPIVAMVVMVSVFGSCGNNGNTGQTQASTDSATVESADMFGESAINSADGIKARLNEILSKGMSMSDEEAVKKYFSKDYQETFFKVEEYDKKNIPEGEIGFWDESIWADGQGGIGNFHSEIKAVNNFTEKSASVIVDYVSDEIKGEKLTTKFDMCFENGNWYIDDIINDNGFVYKQKMKEYLKEFAQNISPASFAGKIYKGSGNGGGLATVMTITFLENHQCTCVSDWYQAYSSPKSIKGNYEVKNNQVIVNCKDNDGTEYKFEFDIKSNGRIIEFDHSDPEMGGTMGNDYMSLEIQ